MTLSLPQLLEGCRAGDRLAIEALVHDYGRLVQRLALSILNDPAEADEAAQDALIAVLQHIGSYRGEAGFPTWVRAITLNVCRTRLRQQKAKSRLVRLLHGLVGREHTSPPQPEQVVIEDQQAAALWRALNSLGTRQRELLVLRYFHELRLQEIAAVMRLSERTVRSHLRTAQDQLRSALARESSGGTGAHTR